MRKSPLKISVFTKMYDPHKNTNHKKVSDYLNQIMDALDVASKHKSKLLILPGHSFGEDPSPNQLKVLQNKINQTEISVLAEIDEHDTRLFSPKKKRSKRMEQYYERADDKKHKAEETLKDLETNRPFTLDNKTFGVLLCGEINILKCVDHKYPEPRYPELGFSGEEYDIWINPAHTTMGEAHLTQKKLSYLSRGSRVAIHCANNDTDTKEAKSTIYPIYGFKK